LQSRDGDIIDCVLSHEQPSFDHPLLKGQKPLVYIHLFFFNLIKKKLEVIFKSKVSNYILQLFNFEFSIHIFIQDPSKRPKGHNQMDNLSDIFQLWNLTGESCPEGTIPIRRTKEQDLLRAGSISRFGRKIADENKHVVCNRRNSDYFLNFFFFYFFVFFSNGN
jgi:hypothetical protein